MESRPSTRWPWTRTCCGSWLAYRRTSKRTFCGYCRAWAPTCARGLSPLLAGAKAIGEVRASVGGRECYQADPRETIAAGPFERLWRSVSVVVRHNAPLNAGPTQV